MAKSSILGWAQHRARLPRACQGGREVRGMGLWCGSRANITALQFFSFSDNSDFNQATEKPITAGVSRQSSGLSSLKSLLFAQLLSRFLRFYSVFSSVSVSEAAFSSFRSFPPSSFHSPFLFLIVCFVRHPALYVRPFFSPFSIPSAPSVFFFSLHSTPKTVLWWSSG